MIRRRRFPNGLVLITEAMPQVRSVSIGVWLRRGSRNETPRLNGISHFIEHLVFKGTQTRSAREIALAMDAVGGQMDAFTSKEYTCFYAKVLDQHLDEAIDLLADIVQHPRFDPVELERERQVILEEIQMVEDTPDDMIYDLFTGHFYGRQRLGRPIQGTRESVSALSRRQLLSFFRGVYRPENMVIAAAGHLNHAKLAKTIRRAFATLPRGKAGVPRPARPRAHPGIVTRTRRDLSQLHLLMGVPAFPERSDRRYSLYVLNSILGGTMSSRLFQRIREEHGLAYAVYSTVNAFADTGFLAVYAATSPRHGDRVVELVLGELRDLRDREVDPQELAVAKENLKGSLMLSLESTVSRMSNIARQEIYLRRQPTLGQTLRGVERVTAGQIRRLATQMFERRSLSLAAVGRVGRLRTRAEDLEL